MGFFEKSQEKRGTLTKFEKKSDFVCLNLQNFYFPKRSNGKN